VSLQGSHELTVNPACCCYKGTVHPAKSTQILSKIIKEQSFSSTYQIPTAAEPSHQLLIQVTHIHTHAFSPAGSVDDLRQRLADDMMATGNLSLALDVNLLNPYAQGVVPPTPSYNPNMAGGYSLSHLIRLFTARPPCLSITVQYRTKARLEKTNKNPQCESKRGSSCLFPD